MNSVNETKMVERRNRGLTLLAALGLALGVGGLTGCKEDAKKAEQDVRAAKAGEILRLDAGELNRLAAAWVVSEKPRDGVIYDVSGVVYAINLHDSTESKDSSYVKLDLIVPEYAASTIRCEFAIEHKDAVIALKQGQMVHLRGKFCLSFSERSLVYLNGCILRAG